MMSTKTRIEKLETDWGERLKSMTDSVLERLAANCDRDTRDWIRSLSDNQLERLRDSKPFGGISDAVKLASDQWGL